jgi:hypothetical protein
VFFHCPPTGKSLRKEDAAMTTKNVSPRKTLFLAVAVLVVLAGVVTAVFLTNRPAVHAGAKAITVAIVNDKATSRMLIIHTDEEYLRGALEQEKLIVGEESAYGLFVKTVDGYTANDAAKEWWNFSKGGESLMTGVDATPIADGDAFEITLTTGY